MTRLWVTANLSFCECKSTSQGLWPCVVPALCCVLYVTARATLLHDGQHGGPRTCVERLPCDGVMSLGDRNFSAPWPFTWPAGDRNVTTQRETVSSLVCLLSDFQEGRRSRAAL